MSASKATCPRAIVADLYMELNEFCLSSTEKLSWDAHGRGIMKTTRISQ